MCVTFLNGWDNAEEVLESEAAQRNHARRGRARRRRRKSTVMAEENGFVSSGDPRVDAALQRLQAKNDVRFKDLEDAMVVQGYLEKKAGERIKEHAQILVDHDVWIEQQRDWNEKQRVQNREIDKRISDLVSAIGELISRQNH